MRAIRDSGALVQLKKGDWPKIPETKVGIYEPHEIEKFLKACATDEWLVFQVFLQTGFRDREVSTLRWIDINFSSCVISVVARKEYKFSSKNYEI